MKTYSVMVRFPSFYRDFFCIGPACTDNCCHSWPIEIDKEHYMRYKAEKKPEFSALCSKYVHRIKKDATLQRYGRLSLDPQGRCGFQDSDGGCRIIRMIGEESLSDTCCLYPRRKNTFLPNCWEISLAMSCQEVVRKGVLAPQMIHFETDTWQFSEKDPLYTAVPTGLGSKGQFASPPQWGDALRTVCIHLMQMREYPVSHRITALFLLMRRLDNLAEHGNDAYIPQETIRFLQSIQQGGLTDFFKTLDYYPDVHAIAFLVPLGHLLAGRQSEVSTDLLALLRPYLEQDIQGNAVAGRSAATALLTHIREKADPLMETYAVWVENYFVNYMFSVCFPFIYRGNGYSFQDHGLLLIQQYAMLRCLLSTVPNEQAPEDSFTNTMVHTARLSQHGNFLADLHSMIRTLQIADNSQLLYLLR